MGFRRVITPFVFTPVVLILSAATIISITVKSVDAAENERQNILFILSDDHRWDFLGSAGHPYIQTPSLDRLAEEGIRFENAFVTSSLCSPSRASFLTGQYAHTHGVKNNMTSWRDSNVTFLEILKQAG